MAKISQNQQPNNMLFCNLFVRTDLHAFHLY
jgi:hypothetical protein